MDNLIISSSPFVRSKNDINKMFLYTSVALIIPACYGIMFFGIKALFLVLISLGVCLFSELIYNIISKKSFTITDFSPVVTGLIMSLTFPINSPYWLIAISAFVAIFCSKIAFGGLGRNKFNPANIGRCFAGVVLAGMSGEFYKFAIKGEPLVSLTAGGQNTISNLVVGQAVGGIGTTCVIIMLVCYVFLVYTSVIDFKIPILAVLSYFLVAVLIVGLEQSVINMCSGSFLFVCVFMLTDPNTSPDTILGKIIYACGYGALCAVVWNMGLLGENTAFAVLLFVNVFVPFMDQYFVLKPISLGGYRNARKN